MKYMPGIKEFIGKFFNPEQKQEEDNKEAKISEDEARQSEDERIEEGNRLRKIAEEAMKGDKAAPEEKIEEKKE
jgi:hypothetical protein